MWQNEILTSLKILLSLSLNIGNNDKYSDVEIFLSSKIFDLSTKLVFHFSSIISKGPSLFFKKSKSAAELSLSSFTEKKIAIPIDN